MISIYDIVICQMVCMGTVLSGDCLVVLNMYTICVPFFRCGTFLGNVVFFQKMKASRWSWPVRWETAILIYTGLICNYAMRMNISIAILKVLVFQLTCIHFMIHILDEQLYNCSSLADAEFSSNHLEFRGPEFHPVCFLLRICHPPGLTSWNLI